MDSSYNGIGSSASSPLFHLWSISVEEQFYIFWPILYIILSKFSKVKFGKTRFSDNTYLLAGILFLIIFSLVFNFTNLTTGSYFSPLARAFELLAGCLLFFIKPFFTLVRIKESSLLSVLRYTFLSALLAIIIYSPNSSYLSIKITTLITILLILGIFAIESIIEPKKWQVFFSNLGKRSYGAYLFHLPIVVLGNQLQFGLFYKILSVVFLIFIVELSYRTVEKVAKHSLTELSFRKVLSYSFIAVAAVFSLNQIMSYPESNKSVDCEKFSIFCTEKSGINNSAEGWVCPDSKGYDII
jgi:peptidoglycan/LPS O-acetylase OafA/YrhL